MQGHKNRLLISPADDLGICSAVSRNHFGGRCLATATTSTQMMHHRQEAPRDGHRGRDCSPESASGFMGELKEEDEEEVRGMPLFTSIDSASPPAEGCWGFPSRQEGGF